MSTTLEPQERHLSPPTCSRAHTQLCLLLHALILGALLIYIAINAHQPLSFDEHYYLDCVSLIDQHGLGREFLLSLPGPAGPLYPVVHYLFRPVTHLALPVVRFVNPVLLLGTLGFLWGMFKKMGSVAPLVSALSLATIPFIWTVTGMALTELPALLLLCASLLMLVSIPRSASRGARLAVAIAGGLLLGAAVMGRQPILVVLLAVPVLAWYQRRFAAEYTAYAIAALILPAIVFSIWHGLVPPFTESVGEGISIPNGIASFMYGALVMAILAPRWFSMRPWIVVVIFSGAMLANIAIGGAQIFPLRAVVEHYLPASLHSFYGSACYGLLAGAAGWFVVATAIRLYERRGDAIFVAFTLAACACIAANAKVTHQFSSRYLVTILPLLLIAAEPFTLPNRNKALRALLGAGIGLASLYSYYHLS